MIKQILYGAAIVATLGLTACNPKGSGLFKTDREHAVNRGGPTAYNRDGYKNMPRDMHRNHAPNYRGDPRSNYNHPRYQEDDMAPHSHHGEQLPDVYEGCPTGDQCDGVLMTTYHFKFDRQEVSPRSSEVTNRTVACMLDVVRNNRDMNFLIVGHADAVGTNEYNQALSYRRANAVKNRILEAAGTNKSTLEDKLCVTGRGSSEPKDKGRHAAAHSQNRRAEIRLAKECKK